MRGDTKVIEYLNKALRHELTAVNQYWLHYRLLDNWGYKTLAKTWRKETTGSRASTTIAHSPTSHRLPRMRAFELKQHGSPRFWL
jgi:bacterioferritin (cytochrome b1)